MSGSFYALDTKYNSLLALVEDLEAKILAISQGLGDVLTVSDDGGGQDMTNLNDVTVTTLNYTNLVPAVPAIIGTIEQVLTAGNDANNLSMTGLNNLTITAGGGGGVTFEDGITQLIAYQGASPTEDLATVMATGNIAGADLDMSTFEINNGLAASDLTIDSNQDLKLTALTDVDIQAGASIYSIKPTGITFPDASIQTTAFTGIPTATETLGDVMTLGNVASANLDMSTFEINNGVAASDLTIDSNQDLKLTALTDVDIQAGASIYSIKPTGITFPDSSIQTTAFTGAATVPSLGDVMTVGNAASANLNMNNANITGISSLTGGALGDMITSSGNGMYNFADTLFQITTDNAGSAKNWTFQTNGDITFPDATVQTTAFTGSATTETLANVMVAGNIAGADLDMSTFEINNGLAASDLTIDSNQDLKLTALTDVDIQAGASIWSFADPTGITFPNGSVQTTAYTGALLGETLASVLTNGNDATNLDMINMGSITGQNWKIEEAGALSPDVNISATSTSSTLFFNTVNSSGTLLSPLSLNIGGAGNVFSSPLGMSGNYIQGISNLVANADSCVFTDDAESRTGTNLTLMGTNLAGNIAGNSVTMIGAGAGGTNAIGNSAVIIGAGAKTGIGAGGVAIGQNAGSSAAGSGAGVNSVAIGLDAASGGSGSGCVAIGNSAGGNGQSGNSISIGTNAGKGTTALAQGSNSICIGNSAGAGFGAVAVPANSLTVSSVRPSPVAVTNVLGYDTTTQEITYQASDGAAMLYPQKWVGSNGNQFLQSNLSGASQTATIELPYMVSSPPVSPTTGSFATTLTLEITYQITYAANQFNWLFSHEYSELVYSGYWLGTIMIQPVSQFAPLTPQAQILTTYTNIGTMFSPTAITNSSGDCARTITPITIDYGSQSDFNKLDIIFGDCDVALTGTNVVGMTSFNRSVRIVDSVAINTAAGGTSASEITSPNSNNAATPIGAYFSP